MLSSSIYRNYLFNTSFKNYPIMCPNSNLITSIDLFNYITLFVAGI